MGKLFPALVFLCLLFAGCPQQSPSLTYSVGGCSKQQPVQGDVRARGVDASLGVSGDYLEFSQNLSYVCCAKMKVYLSELSPMQNYTLVKIIEKNEGEICRCICDYNISARFGPLKKGKYLVQVWGVEFENSSTGLILEGSAEIA